MGQVNRNTCEFILRYYREGKTFPLTTWEQAQLAYAWIEREDARDAAQETAASRATECEQKQPNTDSVHLAEGGNQAACGDKAVGLDRLAALAGAPQLPKLPAPDGGRLSYDASGSLLPEPSYSSAAMREYAALAAREQRDRDGDALSDALQSDLENGVKWLNEKASEKFSAEYPELRKAIAAIIAQPEPGQPT